LAISEISLALVLQYKATEIINGHGKGKQKNLRKSPLLAE